MKLNSEIALVTTLILVVFYGPKVVASYGHPSNNTQPELNQGKLNVPPELHLPVRFYPTKGWDKMASNDSQGRLEDIIGQVKHIFQDPSLGKESSINTQKGNSKSNSAYKVLRVGTLDKLLP